MLSGVSYGAPAFLICAMMADIADADTAEHGAERAGLMYSFLSLTNKFGLGAAVLESLSRYLARMGFDPKIVNHAELPSSTMRVFFILLPMGLATINAAIMLGLQARSSAPANACARNRSHGREPNIIPPTTSCRRGLLPGGVALASDSEAVTKFINDNG